MTLALQIEGDYGAGYRQGLRRLHFGSRFGSSEEHARWLRLGLDGDHRHDLGRGYRDGFSGTTPGTAPA